MRNRDEEVITYMDRRARELDQEREDAVQAKKKAVKKTLIGFTVGVVAVAAGLTAWSFLHTVPAG